MTTLVTGGTGFLGRRLVERLLGQGRTITVLARRPAPDLAARGVRVVQASLDDTEAVDRACAGAETVFHIGAKVGVAGRPADFFRANVLGTRAVIEGCRRENAARLIYTSTPSVVYNGRDIAGADESLPLTTRCSSPYPLSKAQAEREVLAANSPHLQTIALRPHLIFGAEDPHLVPRILAAARSRRLRIIGSGKNRVDMVQVENAVDAHLSAEAALMEVGGGRREGGGGSPAGSAYFITNGEPVILWDWINDLLAALGEPRVTRRISLPAALALGAVMETAWRLLPLRGEPTMTRFVAAELAREHWFDISAARRDLGYAPRISMAEGTAALIARFAAAPPRTAPASPPSRH